MVKTAQLLWKGTQNASVGLQVGYSLNALVDFPPEDPLSIIKHLMVGSEGTLGFISNVTYSCVPEVPHKVGHGEFCCKAPVVVLGAGCMTQTFFISNFLHLLHLLFPTCLLACSILSAFVAVSSKAYDALHTRSTVVFNCYS